MPIYRLDGKKLQQAYDQLQGLANACRDEDGPLPLADATLSTCDLASKANQTIGIDLVNIQSNTVMTARSDDLLRLLYSKLRAIDESDGTLDGKIRQAESFQIDFTPNQESTALNIDTIKRGVVEVGLTMANGSKSAGSAFVVNREPITAHDGSKSYRYTAWTNAHVVDEPYAEESRTDVKLTDGNNSISVNGKVIGVDHRIDVAVLQFETPVKLPMLPIGDSDTVITGEHIVSIGNRGGEGIVPIQGTVVNPKVGTGLDAIGPVIKVNDAAAPGDSGGPTLNKKGQVIGIVSRVERNSAGSNLTLLVPINIARNSAAKILKTGKASYADLHTRIRFLAPAVRETLGIKGFYFDEVWQFGAGAAAGLLPGDIVTSINGSPKIPDAINNGADLYKFHEMLMSRNPGDAVTLNILRGNQRVDIHATLGEVSEEAPKAWHTPYQFTAVELTPALRRSAAANMKSIYNAQGVMAELDEDNGTSNYGLYRRSIITHVNGTPVHSIEEFKVLVQRASQGKQIVFSCMATELSPGTISGSVRHVSVPTQ